MAMALLSVVFSVLMPHFRILQQSWGLKEASAESLQNGRVLLDHISRNLSAAAAIDDISGALETEGYIEFQNTDGDRLRYEVGTDNWVWFGPIGSLSLLAGPVSRFQLSGYAPDDLVNSIADPSSMRFLKIEATFPDPAGVGRDRNYDACVYLRIEEISGGGHDDDGHDDHGHGDHGHGGHWGEWFWWWFWWL